MLRIIEEIPIEAAFATERQMLLCPLINGAMKIFETDDPNSEYNSENFGVRTNVCACHGEVCQEQRESSYVQTLLNYIFF